MNIPKDIIQKVEALLHTKIKDINIPRSGFDHIVFMFKTSKGEKYITKADYNAVVDALVIDRIKNEGIAIPIPRVIAYSIEDKIAIFEFIEGKMLEVLYSDTIIKHFPKILEITSNIHKVKEKLAGDFKSVYDGNGTSWKEFFGLEYTNNHSYYKWNDLMQDNRFDAGLIKQTLQEINESISKIKEPLEYSLLHSDIHGGNIIADDTQIKAIIDWSDANYGDPLYDFARIRLFLVKDNKQMLKIYNNYLDMNQEEKEREKLYYLGHALRILFFSYRENIPELITPNYERLKKLMKR